MKTLTLSILSLLPLFFCSAGEAKSGVLLNFKELKSMSRQHQHSYLSEVAKHLVSMSKKDSGFSFMELLLPPANANGAPTCIGGGVPLAQSNNCGTSSYAGFTCPNNMQICNPLIFGVRENGQPVCFARATTELCYRRIRVGFDTTTAPVFSRLEAEELYADFANQIQQICSGQASLQSAGSADQVSTACHQIRRQTEINRQRNLQGFGAATAAQPEPAAEGEAPPQQAVTPSDPNNPCQSPELTQRVARGGQQTARQIEATINRDHGVARDRQVLDLVRQGHIPEFLTQLRPVRIPNPNNCGGNGAITLCVMPDYLALGTDQDFAHIPLGRQGAIDVARELGFMLPTSNMVDAIFAQSDYTVRRDYETPDRSMTTTRVSFSHSRQAVQRMNGRHGQLVAGHKKDVVLTNLMTRNSGVPIYGWHAADGSRIQRRVNITSHSADYADYSHGIRLVSQTAFVNGQSQPLRDLLSQSQCSSGLSAEGPIDRALLDQFTPPALRPDQVPRQPAPAAPTGTSV
jgi:hypothetical protein